MNPVRVAASSMVVGLSLLSASAAADLPPPNGQKFVPFYAQVSGLDAHADRVLLVYPWSMSNGAPSDEIGVLAAGAKLGFGRRIMGEPKIYAMTKADWEAKKGALTKLPAEGAVDCGTTISPTFLVDSDGPDEMLVSYRVVELTDSACRLEIGAGESSPTPSDGPTDTPADVPPSPSDATPSDGAATPPPPSTGETPAAGGCAACDVSRRPSTSAPWWLLGLAVFVARRARRG